MLRREFIVVLKFCLIIFVLFAVSTPIEVNAKVDNLWLQEPTIDDVDAEQENSPDSASENIGFFDYIKVLFALVFVLALLLLVLRFLNKKNVSYQQSSGIQNLGGISVGPQKSVQVIKVGSQILIVGVGEDVQVLSEVKNESEVEHIIQSFELNNHDQTKPHLFELFNKFNGKKAAHTTNNTEQKFGQVFDKKLSELKRERSDELGRWNKGEDK